MVRARRHPFKRVVRNISIETVLRRDRALVVASLIGVTVLAWLYLAKLTLDMAAGDMSLVGMSQMTAMDSTPWDGTTFALLYVMWLVMMIGMMVPSATPMILLYAVVKRKTAEKGHPVASANVFAAGYVVVWAMFAAITAALQWGLHEAALLSSTMTSTSPILGGALLLAAGAYQLTPLKLVCLRHCRSPMSFLSRHWRKGTRGAFAMGLEHGLYCVGCCWVLMTLLFVGGVMNLLWIAAIMVVVLLEKGAPYGHVLGHITGGALLLAGALLAAEA
jgi:predicted metal-binding membrane protein